MAIFNKQQPKLRLELLKQNVSNCKESLKETLEVYEDLRTAYDEVEHTAAAFAAFAQRIKVSLSPQDVQELEYFTDQLQRVDKCAGNAVRDVQDLVRSQRKRMREAQNEI